MISFIFCKIYAYLFYPIFSIIIFYSIFEFY
nr:MAG TPA: hypothetical protein [Caudoviricetes sp.]